MRNKLYLLGLIGALFIGTTNAQIIKNGAFESWSETNIDNPDGWSSTNDELVRDGQTVATVFPIKKVTGQTGSAIQLSTETILNDTLFGFFSSTDGDPIAGEGGAPYFQQPDSITGYYKYDIKAGDSAVMLVIFKKNGAVVNTDLYKIAGTQAVFTRFAFPLTLSEVPDSVIIAAASSNAIDEIGMQPGSTITFDELAFTGATQAIPGGNFDNWTTTTLRSPNMWNSFGGVARTNDAHKGDFALLLETKDFDGDTRIGLLSSGIVTPNGLPTGGFPYSGTQDTLVFYYKYEPVNGDSGLVVLNFTKNGTAVGNLIGSPLTAAANYVKFEVPFQLGNVPDSMAVSFVSSNGASTPAQGGSKLYVDEVQLKSQPLNTGIKDVFSSITNIQLYPNPVSQKIILSINALEGTTATASISDILGKTIIKNTIEILEGENTYSTAISQLPKGIYFYQVITLDGAVIANKKFIKE